MDRQKIGKLMRDFNPLPAYTLNIFGSLLGVVGFAMLSFLRLPAFVWFFAAGMVIVFLNIKKRHWKRQRGYSRTVG